MLFGSSAFLIACIAATCSGFHVKAAILPWSGRRYFVAKTNGNFPANPRVHGLPTIQGVVILADATNGRVLAVIDSVELTAHGEFKCEYS